jgi:hypothetical protein
VAPNRPFGAICGSLGPIRARRPESGSKVSIWSHLSLPGPDPGQETRKWLQTVHLEPSVAPWARSGPGDPKVAPNRPFGAICRSLGPIRARRPESGSKLSIWSHLSLPGPDPGQETRKWLHKVFWDSSVALGPEPNRDCQTLDCFTPDYYKPHTGHTMVGKCRPHDCRPRTHHTIAGHTQATRRPHD